MTYVDVFCDQTHLSHIGGCAFIVKAKLKLEHNQTPALRTREKITVEKEIKKNDNFFLLSTFPTAPPPAPPRRPEMRVGALTPSSADNATNITEPGAVGGNPCQGEKQLIRSIAHLHSRSYCSPLRGAAAPRRWYGRNFYPITMESRGRCEGQGVPAFSQFSSSIPSRMFAVVISYF